MNKNINFCEEKCPKKMALAHSLHTFLSVNSNPFLEYISVKNNFPTTPKMEFQVEKAFSDTSKMKFQIEKAFSTKLQSAK